MISDFEDQIVLKKVAIIQDYIPEYRRAFFAALYTLGIGDNICYTIYSSDPLGQDYDGSFRAKHLANRKTDLGRVLRWHTNLDELLTSDLVILEQALHNPLLIWKFLMIRPHNMKTYLWGHGGYWTRKNSWLQEKLLWYVVRKADHFFAYTEGGLENLSKHRYPVNKITVLRNSVDTKRILSDIRDLSSSEHKDWLRKHNVQSSRLGCFIGEFRAEKDISFLISALEKIRIQIPDFEFIFFGGEKGKSQIHTALKEHSWITYGGIADSKVKANLYRSAMVILNPGRVGLIAVDSMAMGVPIVTRKLKATHAPEIEYLKHPASILISENDLDSYVIQVVSLLNNPEIKNKMSVKLSELALTLSTENMAKKFHSAIMAENE
jgi:glycosyltransferase involved in cell wall biosynthesis